MADNIIKLKVDSDEYEGKIKRASQGLQALGRSLHDAGKTFADADAKQVEFARELGKMQTVSNTVRGKINELSAAFVNLKSDYLNMADAEKQSPIGQAMAKSLDELKNRTIAAKRELEDLNKELNGSKTPETKGDGGGIMDGAKAVFGGNLMTKGFELAQDAAMRFVNTIKEAAAQGIEMAKAGEGVRLAFERLNQPELLNNLRESTHGTVTNLELMKAAVKFNDFKLPLDQLGTMLAFAQQKAKDTGQSVDYLVNSIVNGLGRKSKLILDNLGISATEIDERMAETGDMTKAVGEIIRDQMAKAGEYTSTAADRATAAQVDLQNAMEEFGRTLLPLQEQGVAFWNELEIGAIKFLNNGLKEVTPGIIALKDEISDLYDVAVNNPWTTGFLDWLETGIDISTRFLPYISKIRQVLDAIKGVGGYQMDGSIGGNIQDSIIDNSITEIPEIVITGHKRNKTKGGKITPDPVAGSIDAQTKKVQELQKAWRAAANDSSREDIKKQIDEAQYSLDLMTGKEKQRPKIGAVDTSSFAPNFGQSNLKELYKVKLQTRTPLDVLMEQLQKLTAWRDASLSSDDWQMRNKYVKSKEGEIKKYKGEDDGFEKFNKDFSKVTSGVGSIVSGIQSLGIELPQGLQNVLGVLQGISSIMSGISVLVALINLDTKSINAQESAQTITSIIPFARGGIVPHAAGGYEVPGTHFSGDVTPILANAGEVVLNRAQVGGLKTALEGAGTRNVNVSGVLRGTDIVIAVDRSLQATGRGELVTWGK